MNCKSCRKRIFDWRDGGFDASAAEAVRAHIASCPACRDFYLEEEALGGRIGAAFRSIEETACAGMPASAAAMTEPVYTAPVPRARFRSLRFLIPAAAGSAILAAVLFFSPWRVKAPWSLTPTTSETVALDDFPDPLRDWVEGRVLVTVEDAARGTRETYLTTRDGAVRRVVEGGKAL